MSDFSRLHCESPTRPGREQGVLVTGAVSGDRQPAPRRAFGPGPPGRVLRVTAAPHEDGSVSWDVLLRGHSDLMVSL